jgi:hypothetical protein
VALRVKGLGLVNNLGLYMSGCEYNGRFLHGVWQSLESGHILESACHITKSAYLSCDYHVHSIICTTTFKTIEPTKQSQAAARACSVAPHPLVRMFENKIKKLESWAQPVMRSENPPLCVYILYLLTAKDIIFVGIVKSFTLRLGSQIEGNGEEKARWQI